MRWCLLEKICHYLTRTAYFHFFFPVLLCYALTDRAINQPTEASRIIFIGRTLLTPAGRAFFYRPAGFAQLALSSFPGQQEEHLSFHMGRYRSPALFIAVYRFY